MSLPKEIICPTCNEEGKITGKQFIDYLATYPTAQEVYKDKKIIESETYVCPTCNGFKLLYSKIGG